MGKFRTIEYVGHGQASAQWGQRASCPVGYKYLTPIAIIMDQSQLAYMGSATNLVGGYGELVEDWNVGSSDTPGTDYNIIANATGQTSIKVLPFKIKNQKVTVYAKNNEDTVANLTFFEVGCKTTVTDVYEGLNTSPLTNVSQMFTKSVLEGIADKLSLNNSRTQGMVMQHSASPTAGSANVYPGIKDSPSVTDAYELSLKHPLTIFDSAMMGHLFTVYSAVPCRVKPGEALTYTMKIPDVFFGDGIEPYLSSELLGHEFTRMLFLQVHGDVAHEGTAAATGLEPAASVTTTRHQGRKQNAHTSYKWNTAEVDCLVIYEFEIESYAGELKPDINAMVVATDADANDMADTMVEVIDDVN